MKLIAALLASLAFWPGFLAAQEFQPMDGAQITAALTDQTLLYEDARQVFYASGQTLYEDSRPSWGRWRVTGDQYCSQWPPSDAWTCYDMAHRGGVLRFIAADGRKIDGVYEE